MSGKRLRMEQTNQPHPFETYTYSPWYHPAAEAHFRANNRTNQMEESEEVSGSDEVEEDVYSGKANEERAEAGEEEEEEEEDESEGEFSNRSMECRVLTL
jgi:hypothetical protein